MGDRDAEALGRLGGGAPLEPPGALALSGDDEHLVGRELAQRVLDRLDGIGVSYLRLDSVRLVRHGLRRLLGALRRLAAGLVLVAREPLERRDVRGGSD